MIEAENSQIGPDYSSLLALPDIPKYGRTVALKGKISSDDLVLTAQGWKHPTQSVGKNCKVYIVKED